jgi:signal transduction histidine kinase
MPRLLGSGTGLQAFERECHITMSAAAVVLAKNTSFIDAPLTIASPEERLRELVHDLRQPLSSIEAIAYYIEMTLPADQFEVRQYMSRLQRLVAETNAILERSVDIAGTACARAASAQ